MKGNEGIFNDWLLSLYFNFLRIDNNFEEDLKQMY